MNIKTRKSIVALTVERLVLMGILFSISVGTAFSEEFVMSDSLETLREYATKDNVKVKMKPGVYRLDEADNHHFIRFTGNHSHFDMTGVTLQIDNELFRKIKMTPGQERFYCVINLMGDGIVFEGLTTQNIGNPLAVSSRNKIFNVAGSNVILRNIDITTSGSSPWGHGSLFGIGGGIVRKMNGIRVSYPSKGAKLINCRVHMRAMGHAIFVQGAADTLIEDCHVDGLLRPTNEILTETLGVAFDRGFKASNGDYVEGVYVGPDGKILPDEMIALSEDGIRMYPNDGNGHATGRTTIRNCTVRRMRRGICVGLDASGDTVVDCEVRDCVAAGFNIGNGDVLENCRANARYAEALSCPYSRSQGAKVDLEILDSRGGLSNTILATLNGERHEVRLHTFNSAFVPTDFTIEMATRKGYAYYQRGQQVAAEITLHNETPARIVKP
ncbi:hypothetical protein ACFL6U_00470 [Planctomycetota bacterium]